LPIQDRTYPLRNCCCYPPVVVVAVVAVAVSAAVAVVPYLTAAPAVARHAGVRNRAVVGDSFDIARSSYHKETYFKILKKK